MVKHYSEIYNINDPYNYVENTSGRIVSTFFLFETLGFIKSCINIKFYI